MSTSMKSEEETGTTASMDREETIFDKLCSEMQQVRILLLRVTSLCLSID